MSNNYIFSTIYIDDNNNKYTLIEENKVVDNFNNVYEKKIINYTFKNKHNQTITLTLSQQGTLETEQETGYEYSITEDGRIKRITTDGNNVVDYFNIDSQVEGIVTPTSNISLTVYNSPLEPYTDQEIHEAIHYTRINGKKLNYTVDMSLVTDSPSVDYITLIPANWLRRGTEQNKTYYNYIQIIQKDKELIYNEQEERGNISNLHAIVTPIDSYSINNSNTVADIINNKVIYNNSNIRLVEMSYDANDNTKVNFIFAADILPIENIRTNILLLKDRVIMYPKPGGGFTHGNI